MATDTKVRLLAKGMIVKSLGEITMVEVHPRGCRGNVHVQFKDSNQTKCYFAESEVPVVE